MARKKKRKLTDEELLPKLGAREFKVVDVAKMFTQKITWARTKVSRWLKEGKIFLIEKGLFRVNPDYL